MRKLNLTFAFITATFILSTAQAAPEEAQRKHLNLTYHKKIDFDDINIAAVDSYNKPEVQAPENLSQKMINPFEPQQTIPGSTLVIHGRLMPNKSLPTIDNVIEKSVHSKSPYQ